MDEKRFHWQRIVAILVFLTLLFSVGYAIVNIIIAHPGAADETHRKVKSDYVLMLLQCLLGIAVMFLPGLIEKRLKIDIPNHMYFAFIIFLYGAIYLGEVRSFYYNIPNWDTILHMFSSAMLGTLGFSIVNLINSSEKVKIRLSPLFVSVFAFMFAVSMGAFWEVYEFTSDGLLGLNMQKFLLEDGIPLVGRAALTDTMKDIIVDMIGAFAACVLGYVSLKYKKGWIDRFELRWEKEEKKEPVVK